jgi:VWFA-related protein
MDTALAPPPPRRVFLIVLGRGRVQYPGKGADGAIHLVQSSLLPQDHVAVLAWDRATRFTTDHAQVLGVLERFKARHEDIESIILSSTSGLAGVYGSRDFPPSARAGIDAVFSGDKATVVPGDLPSTVIPNADRLAVWERRRADALMRTELAPGSTSLDAIAPVDVVGAVGTFDEYVETAVQSAHDLSSIYRGIEYLKYLDGEKHLVCISPGGFTLPSADDDRSLAATAADARVVIDIILTGGTRPTSFEWSNQSAERVSELTGGFFTSLMYASKAVERIDRMSRSSYLLGYTPSNTDFDGRYRRLEVKVNRPGARVMYRHGYYGRPSRPPMDALAILGLTRISSAVRTRTDVADIELLDVTASPARGPKGERETLIELTVSGARLHFGTEGLRRTVKFDLAVFIGDEQQLPVGQTWQTVELKVEPGRHERYVREGFPITLRIPIRRSATSAKVIVYDYGADLVGSKLVRVRKKN